MAWEAVDGRWPRRPTRAVRVRELTIGGGAPISVQTMTKTDPTDVAATLQQIKEALAAGADLIRLAIPHTDALKAFAEIRAQIAAPLIADIHFNHRLALGAIAAGADKIRINPGNIGGEREVAEIVETAAAKGVAIRVGVNTGSLEKELLEKYGGPTAAAAAESALRHVAFLERLGFREIVVSLKASDVWRTVEANRLFARESDCPLHLGITEAGSGVAGIVQSAVGLGILLAEGLGDTIRVSLTAPPTEEVVVGRRILQALGLLPGPRLVSCPMCGRCRVDLQPLVQRVAAALDSIKTPLVVAVMGCEVNGPGEAREADVGLAAGRDRVLLFRHGEPLRAVPFAEAFEALWEEIERVAPAEGLSAGDRSAANNHTQEGAIRQKR